MKKKTQLTAVVYDQGAEKFFPVVSETSQQLAVQVAAVIKLPLLQPVEIARADQRVVSQNPGGRTGRKKKKFLYVQKKGPQPSTIRQDGTFYKLFDFKAT